MTTDKDFKLTLSEHQAAYLADVAGRMQKHIESSDKSIISASARREAAILLLQVCGYDVDIERGQAYKEKGDVRTYVPKYKR